MSFKLIENKKFTQRRLVSFTECTSFIQQYNAIPWPKHEQETIDRDMITIC